MTNIHRKSAVIFLGNGFDVAMGYKTKYSDFYSSNEFKELINSNELTKYIQECNQKTQKEKLWKDLESGLFDFAKNECLFHYAGSDSDCANDFEKDFKELRTALFKYLNRVQEHPVNVSANAVAGLTQQWIRLEWQIVSFNYITVDLASFTHYMKILNADDTINHSKFIYQHGNLYNTSTAKNNPPESIVLGIDETQEVSKKYDFLYKNQNPNRYNIKELIDYVKGKDVIIIYGCSMGQSDTIYFKQIFQMEQKTFIIYCYSKSDIGNVKSRIRELCGSYDGFELRNNVYLIQLTDDNSYPIDRTIVETKTKNIIDKLLQ